MALVVRGGNRRAFRAILAGNGRSVLSAGSAMYMSTDRSAPVDAQVHGTSQRNDLALEEVVKLLHDGRRGSALESALNLAKTASSSTSSELIKVFGEMAHVHAAARIFEAKTGAMRRGNHSPSDYRAVFASMMDVHARKGDPVSVERLHRQMNALGVSPDVNAYSALIRAYGRNQQIAKAEEVFQRLSEKNIDPDEGLYCSLLEAYLLVRDIDKAQKCSESMYKASIEPGILSERLLLKLACARGDLSGAEKSFSRLARAGALERPAEFASMMDLYSHAGYWEQARKVYNDMSEVHKIQTNGPCMSRMLKVLKHLERRDELLTALGSAVNDKMVVPMSHSDVHSFIWSAIRAGDAILQLRMVQLFAEVCGKTINTGPLHVMLAEGLRMKQLELALLSLKYLAKRRSEPYNTHLYNIINLCSRLGKVREVRWVVSVLNSFGHMTNHVQYAAILNAYANSETPEKVEDVLREACEEGGLTPNVTLFNIVLKVLARKGKAEQIREYMVQMRHMCAEPDIRSFNSLAYAHAVNGDAEGVEQTFVDMQQEKIKPNTTSYNILFKLYGMRQNLEAMKECWEAMRRDGLRPDDYSYSALIIGFAKFGFLREATESLKQMISEGYRPLASTFDPVVRGLMEDGKVDDALDLYRRLRNRGLQPSEKFYKSLIVGLCNAGQVDKVLPSLEYATRRFDRDHSDLIDDNGHNKPNSSS
mmetsp:Transcript_1158/g.3588  ORF Transcript_1158/g.3588 Transcript_1158/m.3588 type:complete len:706 (-) Transcript_1158:438-2555(-)|eukprot:CAMPEP_0198731626 /NCGR_PEP_ID=MMETSP1475-20131203/31052_1 /TAXON_ID= ORGANISM="Unidentified sp., Strain CCMP1999" /NCGR_SAMPLE_ID=MMETSP1475 /ASSEMBLY_ACC=CAM_ASM_001111 /LENGTH=705 /DNA_ID=CAMNT_0044494613 /DNA_START=180 /DNA_END=2297 /DNA_ORIENTATION=+